MCNRIVDAGEKNMVSIPEEGYGWKIFHPVWEGRQEYEEESLRPLFRYVKYLEREGWIEWLEDKNQGFCFFLDKREASKALEQLKQFNYNVVLKQIQYRQGIQERDEAEFLRGEIYRVALCHKFRIVEETEA